MYRALASVAAIAAAALALAAFVPLLAPALPQCTDCAFTVRDAYVVQKADRGYIYAGGSSAAYGWIYLDGRPLKANEAAQCRWLNALVRGGIAYVSCSDVPRPVEWTGGGGSPQPGSMCRRSASGSRAAVFADNNTQDLRPGTTLKVFDLSAQWEKGLKSVTICSSASACFKVEDVGACPDFLLAWEHFSNRAYKPGAADYADEVWRAYWRDGRWHVQLVYESCNRIWQEVWIDGRLIRVCNKNGPRGGYVRVDAADVKIEFKSQDGDANAYAVLLRE